KRDDWAGRPDGSRRELIEILGCRFSFRARRIKKEKTRPH
ncbi:unnamed protein product, partial [Linum tenue]